MCCASLILSYQACLIGSSQDKLIRPLLSDDLTSSLFSVHMASSTPPLAERQDIHKSCKSLETLLGVFNDYCEAAGAVTLLQKKLAKALRETAGMKVTGEVPGMYTNILPILVKMQVLRQPTL